MAINLSVADVVVYSGLLGYLAVILLYEAQRSNDRTELGKVITQRRRYAFLTLGQGASTIGLFWLLCAASPHDLRAALKHWLIFGPPGWIVDLGVVLIVVNPLLWARAFARIYRRPLPLAFKRFRHNEYCTTTSYRSGRREFVGPVVPVTKDDLDGDAFANATPGDFGAPSD